ncbi:MAG: hypothetical protein JG763_3157, partial [Shewanella sp.]|nr:hypothetical protein [Shewanella sp.]
LNMAEEQGFEPWMGYKPMPVFKTGAFNHSATPPNAANTIAMIWDCKAENVTALSICSICTQSLGVSSACSAKRAGSGLVKPALTCDQSAN